MNHRPFSTLFFEIVRRRLWLRGVFLFCVGILSVGCRTAPPPPALPVHRLEQFVRFRTTDDLEAVWRIEKAPGSTAYLHLGRLQVRTPDGGMMLWVRRPFTAPAAAELRLRVSGEQVPVRLVFFWMATDPRSPADLLEDSAFRSGAWSDYAGLRGYLLELVPAPTGSVRLRRTEGRTEDEPEWLQIRRELSGLRPGRSLVLRFELKEFALRCSLNRELLFDLHDPQPLVFGWLGLYVEGGALEIERLTAGPIEPPDGG